MWKTPSKSLGTTAIFTTPRHSEFDSEEDQFPGCITSNPKYMRLYQRIHHSYEKAYSSIELEQKQKDEKNINNAITEKITHMKNQKQFEKKFAPLPSSKTRRVLSNRVKPFIGITDIEAGDNKLTQFFNDIDKAFELDEKKRLVEFYLRDFNTQKQNIDFVDKVQLKSRYRRLSVGKSAKKQRDIYQNQREYLNCIKTAYLKKDHLIQNAVQTSYKNPAYLRKKNFERKIYVTDQINHSLFVNRKVVEDPEKQKKFNTLRRLFMHLAECSESRRTYYEYISVEKIEKLHRFLFSNEESPLINQKELSLQVEKIMKYKNRKILQFEDFRELTEILHQKYQFNIESLIDHVEEDKKKFLFEKIEEFKFLKKNQIERFLHKNKIYTVFIALYSNNPNIIAQKYLPFNVLVDFMKKHSLVPKHYPMSKFIGACLWNMHRQEGFTLQQFIEIHVTLALLMKCEISSIKSYFKRLNLHQMIQ